MRPQSQNLAAYRPLSEAQMGCRLRRRCHWAGICHAERAPESSTEVLIAEIAAEVPPTHRHVPAHQPGPDAAPIVRAAPCV